MLIFWDEFTKNLITILHETCVYCDPFVYNKNKKALITEAHLLHWSKDFLVSSWL